MGLGLPPAQNGSVAQAPYGQAHVGLGEATTGYGSGLLALSGHHTAGTEVAVKFVDSTLLGVPLFLNFRYLDNTTQLAGWFTTSLDGVSDMATVKRRVDATGYTRVACYHLYRAGATMYMETDTDGGSDCFVDYFIEYAKAEGSDA